MRLALALALGLFVSSGLGAQDIPEMSAEAATAFAEGMHKYNEAAYVEAAEAFDRAYELDPKFAVAAFFAGLNHSNAGDDEKARAAYRLAEAGKERMSAYYRHRLAAQLAALTGDPSTYYEENRKAAVLSPGSKAAYNLGQAAVRMRQPTEGLASMRTLDPDAPPMRGWSGYWGVVTTAHHQLGDYEAELAAAREAVRRFPNLGTAQFDVAASLIALGRLDEAAPVYDEWERGEGNIAASWVALAAEAEVHGQPETARRLRDRAIAWYRARPSEEMQTPGRRAALAFAHYNRGDLAEAEEIYRALATEFPDNDAWKSWLGILAAERGDRTAAEAEIKRLLSVEQPSHNGSRSWWASGIAGALGDGPRTVELLERSRVAGRVYNVWDHRHPSYRKVRDYPGLRSFLNPKG
jgi:tetratricopeptide (TPR) repeat protein